VDAEQASRAARGLEMAAMAGSQVTLTSDVTCAPATAAISRPAVGRPRLHRVRAGCWSRSCYACGGVPWTKLFTILTTSSSTRAPTLI